VEELLWHLLNVHRVNNVRQIEIHTAELSVFDRSSFEDEIAAEQLNDQVWTEIIQT
jgi:hypothetical protein